MHKATPALTGRVRAAKSLGEKLAILKDSHLGAACVVVTCGPSLKTVDAERLRFTLGGVLSIAVKQAIDVVGDQADFHCWNPYNVSRFDWPSSSTLRCFAEEPTGRILQWNRPDLSFPQAPGGGDLRRSLAFSRQFDAFSLSESAPLPFGPGIMYELVFYLALHLGVSEIVTVGWDIGNSAGKNTHFYDAGKDQAFFEKGRAAATATAPSIKGRMPEPIRRVPRMLRTYRAHRSGELYNRATPLEGETELVSQSTTDAANWLGSKGVSITAVTDSPHVLAPITRLSIEEFLDRGPASS